MKLSVVMGLGWVLGFVAAFADHPPLWYAFIILVSLQGMKLDTANFISARVNGLPDLDSEY